MSDLRILATENSTKEERIKIHEEHITSTKHTEKSINALCAERDFFVYMDITAMYIYDIFDNNKFKKYEKYFEPMTQGYKKIFDEINALFDEKLQ
jgi:hypothetical protein